MYNHPDLIVDAARQHAQGLVDEAAKRNLARALRRRPRLRWPDHGRSGRQP